MSKKQIVKVMVDGGAATAGPPLGPSLGPTGVNTGKVVADINKITASFKGMRVPVEVIIDPATKSYELVVGSPPTSSLVLKALGIEKGGGGKETAGDISFDQIIQVAKDKRSQLLAKDLKAAIKEIVGVCQSLRVTIEGMTPKEITKIISAGTLDAYINGETKQLPKMVHTEVKLDLVSEFAAADKAKKEEKEKAAAEAKSAAAKAPAADGKKPGEDKKGKK